MNERLHSSRALSLPLLFALLAGMPLARADDVAAGRRWVDRPIVLAPFRASFDVGVARGAVSTSDGARTGVGASFEAVVGLPFLVELGVRTGARADEGARLASADRAARLFDHETANLGGQSLANPEVRLRGSAIDFGDVALGLETRFVVPRADGTHFTVAPGVPLRVRFAHVARLDAGLFLPFRFDGDVKYTFSAPAELWIQAGAFFFGPMTAVRIHHRDPSGNRVDVAAGIGLGLTLLGAIDLKAQTYSWRVQDSSWRDSLTLAVGVGVTVP